MWGVMGGLRLTYPHWKGYFTINLEGVYTSPFMYHKDAYVENEFIECEKAFCTSLDFVLVAPNSYAFLISMLSDSSDSELNELAELLLNVSIFASLYPTTKPSIISASCIYLAALILKKKIDAIKQHLEGINFNDVCLFSLSCVEAYQILLNPQNEEIYISLKEKFPKLNDKMPIFTKAFVNTINPDA